METRAPYALVGLLVIAAIGAVFGFVYWLNNAGGLSARTNYEIRFEKTVSGLLKGAGVLFNGIRVGEVIDLKLSADDPRMVSAVVAVAVGTPIRADTHISLEFQGLTGAPVITLEGRSQMAPFPASSGVPVLTADPAAGVSMTQAARDALLKLQSLLSENSEPLHNTLTNLNTFTAALARNSDRLDGIITGVERLTGTGPAAAIPVIYDLTAPHDFPGAKKTPSGQFTIAEPTGVLMFDTQRILVRPSGAEGPTFTNAKWSDNIPKLLQARIIQSFENADLLHSVAKPMEGLTAGHQLLIDIRSFQLSLYAAPQAEVEFSAKILNDSGKIVDARIFRAAVPCSTTDAQTATAAIDEAFGKATVELVVWASALI
jgi:phospholipid/cholesterol/gamma-HCH transport system substrate-binding protein